VALLFIETRSTYNIFTCYILKGGRNSSGHLIEIKGTRTTGQDSVIALEFYLPKDHFIFYTINNAYVKPSTSEINKYFLSGTTSDIILDKTVETKLEYPFNNCCNLDNLPDNPLVRKLSATNITYRQINCFELCFQNFVQKYALENKISEAEAIENEEVKNYDKVKNCDHLCPLECESTQFRISESKFSLFQLSNIEEYSSRYVPFIEKTLNITINSAEEFSKNYLENMFSSMA